jgi:hypothetical protein
LLDGEMSEQIVTAIMELINALFPEDVKVSWYTPSPNHIYWEYKDENNPRRWSCNLHFNPEQSIDLQPYIEITKTRVAEILEHMEQDADADAALDEIVIKDAFDELVRRVGPRWKLELAARGETNRFELWYPDEH